MDGGLEQEEPERDAEDGPGQRREHLGDDQPRGHLSRSGAERLHQRRGTSGVEHRCPRREERVQHGHGDELTVMIASICSSRLITRSDNPVAVRTDEPESLLSA